MYTSNTDFLSLCFPQHKALVSDLLFDFLEFHCLLPFHEVPEIYVMPTVSLIAVGFPHISAVTSPSAAVTHMNIHQQLQKSILLGNCPDGSWNLPFPHLAQKSTCIMYLYGGSFYKTYNF